MALGLAGVLPSTQWHTSPRIASSALCSSSYLVKTQAQDRITSSTT